MVKIVVLLENTTESLKLKCKHGLSLYAETETHKILFDMGPNDLFLKNAESLGVDISAVDLAIISHGHVDHCGGLKYFLEKNRKAKIYIRPQALEAHYVKVLGIPFYAGIDRALLSADRFVFADDIHAIDDEITLFSNVTGQFPLPRSDGNLFVKRKGKMIPDDFSHEQNLIIASGDSRILICGCAHAGIVNIARRAKTLIGNDPTAVIGGMHLYEPTKKRYERDEYIDSVAAALTESRVSYYTCHCTGEKAYEKMKARLGTRLTYLRTGAELQI
jgi:7,8-dihydropterin-6-yl-methyl-4-(beta-D-ribofuranosyl)aminobenzene 5'-phosphate synthase